MVWKKSSLLRKKKKKKEFDRNGAIHLEKLTYFKVDIANKMKEVGVI